MINALTFFAAACNKSVTFFGLPVWYKYLQTGTDALGNCTIQITRPMDYTLIALAVIDILLRLAGMVAVGFIIYGGFQYVLSQSEPDRTKKAQDTIVNALIGLAIVAVSVAIVAFAGRRLTA
jgi:hypothetical protein